VPPRSRGRSTIISVFAALIAAIAGGCLASDADVGAGDTVGTAAELYFPDAVMVTELFETPRDTLDNIDSAAVWHGPAGEHWMLATAKEGDVIVAHDGLTGQLLTRVGGEGREPGRFDRPNGIAIAGNTMLVVERDNARVQALALPDFRPLGSFGEAELRRPYGIAVVESADGSLRVYVTDNYEQADDVLPPDSLLHERVREYRVRVEGGTVAADLVRTFGDVTGAGVLRKVESIAADPAHDRLLIAEEQEGASSIRVYTLDGRFTGTVIDDGLYPYEAEGIALYACDERRGYWVTTDQSVLENTFHVLDRETLAHLGSFRGRTVSNTDGIALTTLTFGPFQDGAFYAVHDDGNVAGFSWRAVAEALDIPPVCDTR